MSKTILAVIGGAVILFLVCCGVGTAFFAGADGPDASTPVPAETSAVPPTQQAKAKALPGVRDGEWLVGTDITPGRYKTAGPAGDFMCYWQITTAPGAEPGEPGFVTNDVPPGQAYVNLKKGQYFTTDRCQPWVKVV